MADYLQSLRLTAVEDTTISLNTNGSPNSIQLEYRTGYGSSIETDWSNFSIDTEYNISSNHWLELRGQNTQFSTDAYDGYYKFTSTGQIDVSGELYSLIEYSAQLADQREYTGCFARLFMSCPVRNAKDLVLPYKETSSYAYAYMFAYCQSLTQAPELPATSLRAQCYDHMFLNCTSLTTAPELPATTLATGCYYYMFNGCTKIDRILWKSKTIPSSTYCTNWLNGASASGTFEYIDPNLDVSSIARDASGVPAGWTIQYLRPKPSLVFSINGKAVTSLMIDGKAVAKLG